MSETNETFTTTFHEGEIALHKSLGVDKKMKEVARRAVRDYMPDQHRKFFEKLSWLHFSAVDEQGHPCAFVRCGAPGFARSPDNTTLVVQSAPLPGERANLNLSPGAKISVVGVEFSTFRRNRLNATIAGISDNEMTLKVDQSFGNCPKYIQQRGVVFSNVNTDSLVSVHEALDETDRGIIAKVDTLFIASRAKHLDSDPRAGVDINHRGGLPGFVAVHDSRTIVWPDYVGNNFFNTFGNISQDPRVDVQLLDFSTGTLLNLQGRAELFSVEKETCTPPDTGRRLRVSIDLVTRSSGAFPFQLTAPEYSVFLPERE